MSAPPFYGKYRGVVSDTADPLMMGRVQATVPDVFGEQASGWALPCAPFGGEHMGFFAIPSVGASVWIEFEHGDPEYPIWSGCWWGDASQASPFVLMPPYNKVQVASAGGLKITLDDTPGIGGITLETSAGQKIVLSESGLEIDNGMGAKISMVGPQVSINSGALDII